jgi:hypothetical protein
MGAGCLGADQRSPHVAGAGHPDAPALVHDGRVSPVGIDPWDDEIDSANQLLNRAP